MAQGPVIRLEAERYRGVLSPEVCESQQRVIARLLEECKAQLGTLDRNAGGGVGSSADRDLLERRIGELEEGLRHLQRLTELGQVVSALLHELIQPVAATSNYITACQLLLPAGELERVAHGLKQAAAQAVRARQVIGQVRNFVK